MSSTSAAMERVLAVVNFDMTPPGETVSCVLPEILDAEHHRMRRVRAIDIPQHEGARLDDAVDDALVESIVVDLQRLVEIPERAREFLVNPVARVDVQLLQ